MDENFQNELRSAMEDYLHPGPNVFIIVVNTQRVLRDEINFREYLTQFFGNDVLNFSLVLFTRADDLEYEDLSLEDYINSEQSGCLAQIVADCNERYLAVSNRWQSNSGKMQMFRKKLVDLIEEIRFVNEYSFYQTERADRVFYN